MNTVRWGIIGCGDVTEVKSGPGFQKTPGSALVAVMRRDRAKAEDFARRHNVPRVHASADDLIADADVDAVYVATPPSTHCDLSLRVAAAGKPCLVEKPMAMDHGECLRMVEAFRTAAAPLWVAYYRRALPRYVAVRDLLAGGAIGRVTSVRVEVMDRLATRTRRPRGDSIRPIAGGGLFLDVGSHCVDLLDYLLGEIVEVAGFSVNTGGDLRRRGRTRRPSGSPATSSARASGTSMPASKRDGMVFTGSLGELRIPLFHEADIVVSHAEGEIAYPIRNPPHVHQPLIQTIVDELHGRGRCESTGESGARATRVLDLCLARSGATAKGRPEGLRYDPASPASAMPAATTTFSESTPSAIGMRTLTSARLEGLRGEAGPFSAEQQDERLVAPDRGGIRGERSGDAIGGQRGDLESTAAKQAEVRRPGLQPRERHVERRAHRRPDRFSVKRIAARAVEEHAARIEGGGHAKQPADVVGIRHRFERHQPARAGKRVERTLAPQAASRSRGSPDGNRIPLSDASSDSLDDLDGTPDTRADVGQAFGRGGGDDDGDDLVSFGLDEPPDDEAAFGDEQAVRPQPHGVTDVRVAGGNIRLVQSLVRTTERRLRCRSMTCWPRRLLRNTFDSPVSYGCCTKRITSKCSCASVLRIS